MEENTYIARLAGGDTTVPIRNSFNELDESARRWMDEQETFILSYYNPIVTSVRHAFELIHVNVIRRKLKRFEEDIRYLEELACLVSTTNPLISYDLNLRLQEISTRRYKLYMLCRQVLRARRFAVQLAAIGAV